MDRLLSRLNGGYSWTSSNAINQTYADTLPGGLATNAALGNIPSQEFVGNSGFIGGGQVGFNWQFDNRIVIGLEADIDGLTGGSKTTNIYGFNAATSFSAASRNLGRSGPAWASPRPRRCCSTPRRPRLWAGKPCR